MSDVEIEVTKDTASPALDRLRHALSSTEIKDAVGTACLRAVKDHLLSQPPNKQGWPSQSFWQGAARGSDWQPTADGITITVDNEAAPGAVRHLFHGGTVTMRDKMLTIPAAAQFYGRRAGEFTDLKLAILGGHPALVVSALGAGIVNFETGTSRLVKGTGPRSQRAYRKSTGRKQIVAFWLKESVMQGAHPEIIPDKKEHADVALDAVLKLVEEKVSGK